MTYKKLFAILLATSVLLLISACSEKPNDLRSLTTNTESYLAQFEVTDSHEQQAPTELSEYRETPLQPETQQPSPLETPLPSTGNIYLYGEVHGVESVMNKEFELWYGYYHNENMRHLFVEYGYFTAEFLNLWMQSDNDDILDAVYNDWAGTQAHVPAAKEFYLRIKTECPETIFHGTDVGHQYDSTGSRYLDYLSRNGMADSETFRLANEAIEQGREYYSIQDNDRYREDKMVENFIREFDSLGGESVMGIYGVAHTGLDALAYGTDNHPCMANQLKERYSDAVYTEDLSWLALDIEPERMDIIVIGGKEYQASYYGKVDISAWSSEYTHREFWRLENAYNDFRNCTKTGDVLPYNDYPMLIDTGQVFVIDYTKKDDSVLRMYFRSDGRIWNGMLSTEEFHCASFNAEG